MVGTGRGELGCGREDWLWWLHGSPGGHLLEWRGREYHENHETESFKNNFMEFKKRWLTVLIENFDNSHLIMNIIWYSYPQIQEISYLLYQKAYQNGCNIQKIIPKLLYVIHITILRLYSETNHTKTEQKGVTHFALFLQCEAHLWLQRWLSGVERVVATGSGNAGQRQTSLQWDKIHVNPENHTYFCACSVDVTHILQGYFTYTVASEATMKNMDKYITVILKELKYDQLQIIPKLFNNFMGYMVKTEFRSISIKVFNHNYIPSLAYQMQLVIVCDVLPFEHAYTLAKPNSL